MVLDCVQCITITTTPLVCMYKETVITVLLLYTGTLVECIFYSPQTVKLDVFYITDTLLHGRISKNTIFG